MEKRHGWVLATYLRRAVARLLDVALFHLPLVVFLFTAAAAAFGGIEAGYGEDDYDYPPDWITRTLLVSFLFLAGYGIWWLFALRRGQTPGKQLMGIRVIKADGLPSGWGYTFLREFVIKGLLENFLASITSGVYLVVDYLWPLWDKDRQTLHDKMISTLVVRARR